MPSRKVPQVAWRSVKVSNQWVPAAEALVLFLCSHLASIAKGDEDFWQGHMPAIFWKHVSFQGLDRVELY